MTSRNLHVTSKLTGMWKMACGRAAEFLSKVCFSVNAVDFLDMILSQKINHILMTVFCLVFCVRLKPDTPKEDTSFFNLPHNPEEN